ncbi:MAG TPA: outer membrane protein assembly factor BamE [Steroidobacteraceae bacterium]
MNPPRIVIATHRSLPISLFLGTLLALATACVYRPNIQQGNLLRLEDVDQVTAGMTRSQVRYLIGTPMVSDPFQPNRWDYIYTLRRGHERKLDRAYFVVYFDGDKVSKIDKVDAPELSDIEKMRARQAEKLGTPGVPTEPTPATPDPAKPGG